MIQGEKKTGNTDKSKIEMCMRKRVDDRRCGFAAFGAWPIRIARSIDAIFIHRSIAMRVAVDNVAVANMDARRALETDEAPRGQTTDESTTCEKCKRFLSPCIHIFLKNKQTEGALFRFVRWNDCCNDFL